MVFVSLQKIVMRTIRVFLLACLYSSAQTIFRTLIVEM